MRVLGLTGSIAMGKTNAAGVFRRLGVPVFDADATVHALQRRGGAAVRAIDAAFPGVVKAGAVDRAALRQQVLGQPARLRQLEAILHPLVGSALTRFVQRQRRLGASLVVLDIPLLLETTRRHAVDTIVVVTAPACIQAQRLRQRRTMSETQITAVLQRQMPDASKRRLADVLIRTGLSRHYAQAQIRRLVEHLR